MKIQKQLGRKVGDKSYYKHVIVVPDEVLEEAGFKTGDELETDVVRGEIKLTRA